MNQNDDFFLKQMKGVVPIKKNNKIEKKITEPKTKNFKETKRTENNFIKNKPAEKVLKKQKSNYDLHDIDIKKNIKNGSLVIDKKIDFHGKTLLEAEEEFSTTIINCYRGGLRCLLFITGKGVYKSLKNNENNKPKLYHGVIRAALINWVKSKKFSKYILSYNIASIAHGGDGAFYVYLRKKKD